MTEIQTWTANRIALLKNLWQDEMSAACIARQLGGGLTRSAVIGKLHRLGISQRASSTNQASPRPHRPGKPSAPRRFGPTMPSVNAVAKAIKPVELKLEPPAAVPAGNRVSLMMLSDKTCRWPCGDPLDKEEFHFCGLMPESGSVYCTLHRMYSVQSAHERKQNKQLLNLSGFAAERAFG